MARRWGSVDYEEFEKAYKKMKRFEEIDADAFCRKVAKNLAARLLRGAIQRTPIKSGDLKRAWTTDYNVVYRGNEYRITIYNSMKYASYVEFGHRTRNHKGWVTGRKMLTKAELTLEQHIPSILEKMIEKELRKIFDD